jgi:hypothetical protein
MNSDHSLIVLLMLWLALNVDDLSHARGHSSPFAWHRGLEDCAITWNDVHSSQVSSFVDDSHTLDMLLATDKASEMDFMRLSHKCITRTGSFVTSVLNQSVHLLHLGSLHYALDT